MSLWDYISPSSPLTLLESWSYVTWGVWVLVAISLILLYRHGVLSYGAQRKGWESLLLFLVWMSLPQVDAVTKFGSMLCLLFVLGSVELVLNSYALQRTPFLTFDVGLWLGLLSLVHPAFLLICPFIYIQLRSIHLATTQHTSAYLLGILSAWWLVLLVMAEPTWEGVNAFVHQHLRGFTEFQLLPRALWPSAGLYVALLLFITARTSALFGRAVNRHRWSLVTHLWLAWLFGILWMIYGGRVHSFFVASLFFTSASFTFLTGRGEASLFTKLFVILLSLAAIVTTITFIH